MRSRFSTRGEACLAGADYEAASLRWIRQIIAALPREFPVILFATGAGAQLRGQSATGARVLSLDWTVDLRAARDRLPAHIALQGNLDPQLLTTTPDGVRTATTRLLESLRGTSGHIFNLRRMPPRPMRRIGPASRGARRKRDNLEMIGT